MAIIISVVLAIAMSLSSARIQTINVDLNEVCSVGELALRDTFECQLNGYTCTNGDGPRCCEGRQEESRSCIPCDETRHKKPNGMKYTTAGTCDFDSINQMIKETFVGYCRDRNYHKEVIKYIQVSDASKCHDLCKITASCVAFAFNRNVLAFNQGKKPNCNLYQGGPYTMAAGMVGVSCYLMSIGTSSSATIATPPGRTVALTTSAEERISIVGPGWCRPKGCDVTRSSCRLKCFGKDGSSYQECSTACFRETSCVGFAISDKTYGYPNRCYVYGNISQRNALSGWQEHPYKYFEILTSSNHNGIMCYKRIGEMSTLPSQQTVSCDDEDNCLEGSGLSTTEGSYPSVTTITEASVGRLGWGLLRKGSYCAVKKVHWNNKEQTIDECMDHCERNQATIALYRSLNKNCACCKDPPGIIVGAQQINMYQYQGDTEPTTEGPTQAPIEVTKPPSTGNLQISGTCFGTYDNGRNEITTPNYPNVYPASKRCSWNIEVAQGNLIELEFEAFRLEASSTCAYDWLQIYDGRSSGSRALTGKLCDRGITGKTLSTGNTLFLNWRSDSSNSYKGFKVSARLKETTTSVQETTTVQSTEEPRISIVGPGWCRPGGCDVTSSSCLVNSFSKDGSSYQECSTSCFREASCVGFAISDETYGYPNKCYIYGNISKQNAPNGWREHRRKYFDIHTTSNHNGIMCYKRIAPSCEPFCDSCESYGDSCPNAPVCQNGGSCYCDKGPEASRCYCFGGYTGLFCEILPATTEPILQPEIVDAPIKHVPSIRPEELHHIESIKSITERMEEETTTEFSGSGYENPEFSSGLNELNSQLFKSTRAPKLQPTENIQSTQGFIQGRQSSHCRDQKIWCNVADCRLANVKRNCQKTCNLC